MTDIAARIAQRLTDLGISERSASIDATGSPNTIRNIRLGDSKNPRSDTIRKLARALQCSPEWLLTGRQAGDDIQMAPEVHSPTTMAVTDTVPVLGTAAGSLVPTNGNNKEFEGFLIDSEPTQYMRLPYGLAGQKDIYAFYIVGDSMDPMHPPGEVRFAQPHRPPSPGDTVVIQTKHWEHDPGQAYIKIFRRRTSKALFLEQINPLATLEIPRKFIIAMHRVVPNNELFGI